MRLLNVLVVFVEGFLCITPVILMQYLRLHTGGAGENTAKFLSTCVHVMVVLPISSKPELQV